VAPPRNLTEPYEGLINKAVADAQVTTGLTLSYIWSHSMIPTPGPPGLGWGMVIEIRAKSPFVGQEIPHIMILDNSTPTPMEVISAVATAAKKCGEIYQAMLKMPAR